LRWAVRDYERSDSWLEVTDGGAGWSVALEDRDLWRGFCSGAWRWTNQSTRNIRGGLEGVWKRGRGRTIRRTKRCGCLISRWNAEPRWGASQVASMPPESWCCDVQSAHFRL
jgi:hypothetical protein